MLGGQAIGLGTLEGVAGMMRRRRTAKFGTLGELPRQIAALRDRRERLRCASSQTAQ